MVIKNAFLLPSFDEIHEVNGIAIKAVPRTLIVVKVPIKIPACSYIRGIVG